VPVTEPSPVALVATLGLSPAVVTRVLDHLLFVEKLPLREVVVVHTGGDQVHRGIQRLLGSFPGARLDEIDGIREVPEAVYRVPGRDALRIRLLFHGLSEADLLEAEDNKAVFAALARHVWRLRRSGHDVVVSLAGGRKQQSAYALLAAVLFGARRAVHLIPVKEHDNREDNEVLHVSPDWYRLVGVPFPVLGDVSDSLASGGPPEGDREMLDLIERICSGVPAVVQAGLGDMNLLPGEAARDIGLGSEAMRRTISEAKGRRISLSPLYLFGPPGSGRGTLAEHLAGERDGPVRILDGANLEDLFFPRGPGLAGEEWSHPLEDLDGGTLVIKNLDRSPLEVQKRILPLLDRLPRLLLPTPCSPSPREIRLWLVVTAARDLPEAVSGGDLAEGWPEVLKCSRGIRMPSLWERREDVPGMVSSALQQIARDAGIAPWKAPPGLLQALQRFDFTGLEVADLVAALRTWMGKSPGEWEAVPRDLEAARRSPAWAPVELRERKILEEWFNIRRRPGRAAELASADPGLLEDVRRYALEHFRNRRELYPEIRSERAFLGKYFPSPGAGSSPPGTRPRGRPERRRRRPGRGRRRGR